MPSGQYQEDDKGARYIPTEAEIEQRAREVREHGYLDRRGHWHDPWITGNVGISKQFDELADTELDDEQESTPVT